MDKNDPKPDPKPSGKRPPPRPPKRTVVGFEDDDSGRKGRVTITKSADGEGKFIRQSGGRGHHGHIIVRVEPNGRGKGSVISSEVSGGSIPEEYIKATTEGIRLLLEDEDRPVVDIIVRIVGGSLDERDSNELAFTMAGIFAIKDALKEAGTVAIEGDS
jgi:elongation factor G